MKFWPLNKSILLTILISLTSIVYASESVNKSLSAKADGVVEIHNVRGDIKIIGWDKNKVEIKGELDDLAEELIFETHGKVTVIRVKLPKRSINHGDGSDLVIRVPKANRVDFNGVSTDLNINNISGGIDIRSVSGDVDVDNVRKQLFINTVSGEISLKNSSGKAKLTSVSGEIDGECDSKDIAVDSVSGTIELKLKEFDNLLASNVSGDVWVKGQQSDSGQTRLSSVTGDITLAFEGEVNARAKINTGPGGWISNDMSSDEVKNVFPNQQKLIMTLGDGSGRIKIGTVTGGIKLKGKNQ